MHLLSFISYLCKYLYIELSICSCNKSSKSKLILRHQTTQPTSDGGVTDDNCCANCVGNFCTAQIYPFWASRLYGPAGWLVLLLIEAGDVETNPGPTTAHKQVWMCDICHKQIHGSKQISIRCNSIEHWVKVFPQARYTETWTCYIH